MSKAALKCARLMFLAMLIVGSLITMGIFQPTKTALASTPTGMTWPVHGYDGTWSIPTSGYYNYDHGCWNTEKNSSGNIIHYPMASLSCDTAYQLYGLDLFLNNSGDAAGKDVISPVNGRVTYDFCSNYPGCMVVIQVGSTSLRIALTHIDNPIAAGSSVIAGATKIGTITGQGGNSHLHFSLYTLNGNDVWQNRKPVPFMNDTSNLYGGFDTHIQGCGDFKPNGVLNWSAKTYSGTQNQWVQDPINCGLQVYGYWMGPTPTGTDQFPIQLYGNPAARSISLGYHSVSSSVDYVDFWQYQSGKWIWMGRQNPDGNRQEFASFTLSGPGYIGVDAHTTDGKWHMAENGIRALCVIYPNGSKQCPNLTSVIYHDGSVHSPGLGGGGTPPPTDGIVVCQNTNYGSPCETFHYTVDDVCIGLDQMSGHNRSVQDINNAYSVIMFHDNGCGTYLARYETSIPDIGSGLYDQFNSMKLEKHMPPNAVQTYPANIAVLPAGTTTLGLTFQNGKTFTVHVWGSSYDVWQANINATWFTINGLQNGATYQWQVQGTDQYGTGSWSSTWTFSVADNAKQISPANGSSLPSGTTQVQVTFSGQSPFTLHVWGPNFDLWQANITDSFYQVTGLPASGGTFNWQIIGSSGPWSDTWTFKVNPPSNAAPCGKWISPNNDGYVITKGNPQVITVRAYPCNSGDAAISHVAFMIGTPDRGIDNMSVLCIVNTPDAGTQDQYSCKTDGQTTDGQYMPAGDILISFNVDNTNDVESDFPDGALMGTQQ